MSMTREEAINAFEAIKLNAQNHLGKKYAAGCEGYYRDKIELADAALAALRGPTREMVEKMRGEWRSIHGLAEYYCSRCGEEFEIHSYDKEKYQFCPHCLAPMTDEAVEMMLKRWKEAVEGV